jgi:hypothetical protein
MEPGNNELSLAKLLLKSTQDLKRIYILSSHSGMNKGQTQCYLHISSPAVANTSQKIYIGNMAVKSWSLSRVTISSSDSESVLGP